MIIASFKIAKEQLDLMEGHARLLNLVKALEPAFPDESWFRLPHSQEESDRRLISISDTDRFLRQTARDMGAAAERWQGTGEGYSALITTASTPATWERPGNTSIDYSPRRGVVRIETFSPPGSPSAIYEQARDRFLRACTELDVTFANCDFPRAPRPNGSRGELYYGGDLQVFPHREFLGWMGFVRRGIERHEVPEADELIPLPMQEGTMIVAVADAFDVHNAAHIEKAQRVEMRLVDIDALPVTDPRFLQ